MPVIPVVGRKSLSIRLWIIALYALLTLGAVTMVYPFSLMLSTAMTGYADWYEFKLIPSYFFSQAEQFRKYMFVKGPLVQLAYEYGHEDWHVPSDIEAKHLDDIMATPGEMLSRITDDYAEFIHSLDKNLKQLNFTGYPDYPDSPLCQSDVYFDWLTEKYGHDIDRVNALYDDTAKDWEELGYPRSVSGVWEPQPRSPRNQDWREFVESRPCSQLRLDPLDFWAFRLLRETYGSVESLNETEGTSFKGFFDLGWKALSRYGWAHEQQGRFLRSVIGLEQLRLKDSARPEFETFLKEKAHGLDIEFTTYPPKEHNTRAVWIRFVRSENCRFEYFDPIDPQVLWADFLRGKYRNIEGLNTAHGSAYSTFEQVRLPAAQMDYLTFSQNRGQIVRSFIFSNFAKVIGFILINGRAMINTLVLILCTITAALTVNPMAAYVLSRFRLRYAHHILIFLLATMAFPAEVCMIPGFLIVKNFPLGAIMLGATAALLFIGFRMLVKVRIPVFWSALVAALVAVLAGYYLPPLVAEAIGRKDLNVSLMNTFFALVLPGVANGYAIFLLKGFFDSLPPELYEAAMLDGASEARMFLKITLPLCKPILAVMALGAFTVAYGAFIFAFLTCQDPKMWTLMVFLFQFQQSHSVPLVMASLVISAIPTLLVFAFCQNIILRGIVIPTFK